MPKVTIDADRITHIDGKPFFLIGARHMPDGSTPELLRDAGFNAFRNLTFGTESDPPGIVAPDIEGIYFWAYLFNRADFTKSSEHEQQLRQAVQTLRDHRALLCYENLNEPTLRYPCDRFKAEPDDLARGTQLVRELDPHHPIWMAHCCHNTVETLRRFNSSLDIVGSNPYPVYPPGMRRHIGMRPDGKVLDCPDQSVHAVGKYTDKMIAVAQGKSVWMLIQGMANESWFNPAHTPELAGQALDEAMVLYPSFAQMRFMAYDAIVSGATGLAFALWKTPTRGQIWGDISRLVAELQGLHDALCAPPLPGEIHTDYIDLGFSIWDGVRVLARLLGDKLYLFAANTSFDPTQVAIRLPVAVGNVAIVETEQREIPVEGQTIRDYFEPYGVHVYRMRIA